MGLGKKERAIVCQTTAPAERFSTIPEIRVLQLARIQVAIPDGGSRWGVLLPTPLEARPHLDFCVCNS